MKQAFFIEVQADVRYWEDGQLNGKVDTNGEIPLRNGDCWEPVIELSSGQIQHWPQGMIAKVYYKVCDAGAYWLLDEHKTRIARWKGNYVPDDILCVGKRGHGDYIIFSVDEDGRIIDWKPPAIVECRWVAL